MALTHETRSPRRLAVVACAALVAMTGCQRLGFGKAKNDAGSVTVRAPAPDPSAVSVLADAKTKMTAIKAREDSLPKKPSESLKPLDNGAMAVGGAKPNVAILWVVPESLNQFEVMSSYFDESDHMATTCYVEEDKAWSDIKSEDRTALEVCAGFKYALFVRVNAYTKPTDDVTNDTFTPGSIDADLFLYNVDTGAALGGFAAKATSSKRFLVKGFELDAAGKDLGQNLQDAIATRWEKLAKTKDFPRATRVTE